MTSVPILADRRHFWAFAAGSAAVTAGVLLHLPMLWMGHDQGFRLVGMPMDAGMWWGMVLICAGIAIAAFGCTVIDEGEPAPPRAASEPPTRSAMPPSFVGTTWALSITALAWGLINFGLLLWMPAHLVAKGYSMAVSSQLLAASALIALPTVFAAALLYGRWSSKGALLASIGLTALGLVGVVWLELAGDAAMSPVWSIALLIVGINGIIAMLLPYAAESYPLKIRGRATGWIAACTQAGGLVAQLLGLLGLVPGLLAAAAAILLPVLLALGLVAWFCAETRGRDLRELDGTPREGHPPMP